MAELSYSEISKLLKYEPATGKLYWLPRTVDMCPSDREAKRWNARYANQEALIFSDNKGYRRGHILGRLYRAAPGGVAITLRFMAIRPNRPYKWRSRR
jgi:hypothetical protein